MYGINYIFRIISFKSNIIFFYSVSGSKDNISKFCCRCLLRFMYDYVI